MRDSLVAAFSNPLPCSCQCHETLTLEQRAEGIQAMYRFDDAFRGWGYEPIYEVGADRMFRAAQKRNDSSYRGIAVRDEPCLYRRFVGFAVHEMIHALCGDVTKANYGIPFGAPYGVPAELPLKEEATYLDTFNRHEARAWAGVQLMGQALYGIEWALRPARDVGTYGFPGGTAVCEAPAGFRAVPHFDREHHPERYYMLARALEAQERAWFTQERVTELSKRVAEAEAAGRALRAERRPSARALAELVPKKLGRNDRCSCRSGKKAKHCCLHG